jgi:hypothetical protein
MLNFKSVTNSEPQIRSNPALRQASRTSGFHKRLSTLLESTPLPFPTFQLVKDASSRVLSTFQHYAWVRPVHLRCQWLVLSEGSPAMLVDAKDNSRLFTIRIPFDTRRIEHEGTVVCEVAWDAQDHILYIWDVVVWQKQVTWGVLPYSKRWSLVKDVVSTILDSGHPMSDAEVRVPEWKSLEEIAKLTDLDPATSIEFQPEQPGQRRFLYRVPNDGVAFVPSNHAERSLVANEKRPQKPPFEVGKLVVKEKLALTMNPTQRNFERPSIPATPPPTLDSFLQTQGKISSPTISNPTPEEPRPSRQQENPIERPTVCKISKNLHSKLPDSYRLTTVQGEELGLAAIRTLEMSKLLRKAVPNADSTAFVDIQWCEHFQKYEVRRVHMPSPAPSS